MEHRVLCKCFGWRNVESLENPPHESQDPCAICVGVREQNELIMFRSLGLGFHYEALQTTLSH
jgi:hypothetical protein